MAYTQMVLSESLPAQRAGRSQMSSSEGCQRTIAVDVSQVEIMAVKVYGLPPAGWALRPLSTRSRGDHRYGNSIDFVLPAEIGPSVH